MPQTKAGLEYEVLQAGDGEFGQFLSLMTINYTIAPAGGDVVFDSRDEGEPVTYPAGAAEIIPGIDLSAAVLQEGSTVKIVVPPDYGYRDREIEGALPPFSTLDVVVEVLKVEHQEVPDELPQLFVDPRELI